MSKFSVKDLVDILRGHGIVATPHRYRILEYFMESEILEAVDDCHRTGFIHKRLLEEGYFISQSSVYKNLCLFRSVGILVSDDRSHRTNGAIN